MRSKHDCTGANSKVMVTPQCRYSFRSDSGDFVQRGGIFAHKVERDSDKAHVCTARRNSYCESERLMVIVKFVRLKRTIRRSRRKLGQSQPDETIECCFHSFPSCTLKHLNRKVRSLLMQRKAQCIGYCSAMGSFERSPTFAAITTLSTSFH